MVCTAFWWRLGEVRNGLDSQARIHDIARSAGYASCRIFARENSVPGLDYLIAAHGKSRATGLDVSRSTNKQQQLCYCSLYNRLLVIV